MQITGKDDDQEGTINAQLAYSIVSQEPEGSGHMFTIERNTGKLFVKEPTLDREVRLALNTQICQSFIYMGNNYHFLCKYSLISFIH